MIAHNPFIAFQGLIKLGKALFQYSLCFRDVLVAETLGPGVLAVELLQFLVFLKFLDNGGRFGLRKEAQIVQLQT